MTRRVTLTLQTGAERQARRDATFMFSRRVLCLYEPRWRGLRLARYEIQERTGHGGGTLVTNHFGEFASVETVHVEARGWWRPPRGWAYQEIELPATGPSG
jgi:hypothetical protein